jgi:hypothetical protein
MLFRKATPRRFQFQPRYYRENGDEDKRIKFRRLRTYDPHSRKRMGWLVFLILLVGLILYLFSPHIFPHLRQSPEVTIETTDVP